jgi:hypothetical protein
MSFHEVAMLSIIVFVGGLYVGMALSDYNQF